MEARLQLDELTNEQLEQYAGGYSDQEVQMEYTRTQLVVDKHVMTGADLSYFYARAGILEKRLGV